MNEAPKVAATRKKGNSLLIGIALLAAFPLFGFAMLLLKDNPCATMLKKEQALKLALHGDAVKTNSVVTSHSCSVVLRDSSGQVVLSLQMRGLKAWDSWLAEVEGNGFSSTPLAVGDRGMLYQSPSAALVPASLPAEKVAERVSGHPTPREQHGPESVALISAGPNALQLIVHGPPERAQEVVNEIVAPQLQLLRDASF